MSFGRSLMNACTLGAWGWLTDPDVSEFYFEIGGTIEYSASGDGIEIAKKFFKDFNVVVSKKNPRAGYFKTVKDADKAMREIYDNFREKYKRNDLVLMIEAPEHVLMNPRDPSLPYTLTCDSISTLCKECGRHVAYGRRVKATNVRCPKHPKAGKFVVESKKAATHEWYHMRSSAYDLYAYRINDSYDIESDDYEEYED